MPWFGVKWTDYKLPPVVTSDFVYLRLIGDRRLAEDQFGKIQIDRTEEISNWANRMKDVRRNEKDVKVGIVAANNHHGGYVQELSIFFDRIWKWKNYHLRM